MERTFLLGVGAQKAGTTWLYRALSASPKVNFGSQKEYHIWDALYSDLFADLRLSREKQAARNKEHFGYLMQTQPGYYASYFNRILNSGAELTGDITPAYSILTEEDFRRVRKQLDAIDARLSIVFLMRDPFERCWSAIRMMKLAENITETDEDMLLGRYDQIDFILRTRYDRTVRNLRSVFSETELYFGLYETMLYESELQRMSDFLGTSINRAAINERPNVSPKIQPISSQTREAVQGFYSEVYEFCCKEFPESRIHWLQ